MDFDMKASVGIYITSYEISQDNELRPILSHIFWGETFKQALGYAKSHLIADVFFNGTFIGDLPRGDTMLYIDYEGEILALDNIGNMNINQALKELTARAIDIREKEEKFGLLQIIQKISK